MKGRKNKQKRRAHQLFKQGYNGKWRRERKAIGEKDLEPTIEAYLPNQKESSDSSQQT